MLEQQIWRHLAARCSAPWPDCRRLLRTTSSFRFLHVSYFLFFSLLGALALWLLLPSDGDGAHRFALIDSLFFSVSALSVTGLGTLQMHRFSIPAQIVLVLLMILGSQVFTSAIPLFIRGTVSTISISRLSLGALPKYTPSRRFSFGSLSRNSASRSGHHLKAAAEHQARITDLESSGDDHVGSSEVPLIMPAYKDPMSIEMQQSIDSSPLHQPPTKAVRRAASMPAMPSLKWSEQKMGSGQQDQNNNESIEQFLKTSPLLPSADHPELSVQNNIINAGPPVKGLIEQEALAILSWLVFMYFIVMQVIGSLFCLACLFGSNRAKHILQERKVNLFFFAFFSTVSAFANAGFTLLDDSLVSMQEESAFLLWLCVLILVGNTLYAPVMRAVVWVLYRLEGGTPADDELNPGDIKMKKKFRRRAALRYLLKSPRRCFTHLFPQTETLWLVFTVAMLNCIQMAAICGLDWHGPVFDGLKSNGYKFVNALFSSITTRNAGLNVVNVADFSAPTLVLLVVMMYIAVYPVYLSRERSREKVDGSRSHSNEMINNSKEGIMANSKERMAGQFRALLARDSLYLFFATFCICLTERNSIRDDPLNFSIFNILFEIISAYGNVGLSMGYSCALQLSSSKNSCVDVPYSLSGKWSTAGKFILICIMLLGRHRGLPDDLDWAISLPSYKYIVVYPVYLSRERSIEQVGGSSNNLNKMITTSKERMVSAFYTLLIRDSIHLVIATFCICLTERNSIREDPLNFSIFNIAFEIVSGYGNVGLSMGYSCALQVSSSKNTCVDVPYSFSGKWSPLGKLFLICVMLLGRHRGLPDELDWAISLPSYK